MLAAALRRAQYKYSLNIEETDGSGARGRRFANALAPDHQANDEQHDDGADQRVDDLAPTIGLR